MSDQNKYINTYVDKSVGMLHEYIGMVIQLRTQLHLANDLIQEKDQIISSLKEENEKNVTDHNEIDQAKNLAKSWEDQYNAMKNKVSHMDTFTNQINEMKQALLAKNNEIDNLSKTVNSLNSEMSNKDNKINDLNNQINDLKKLVPKETSPKKVINTKSKSTPIAIQKVTLVEETDDF